ncbi:6,7-dimethyl-8-ribityllumazine synthase [Chelatococcus sambhunathii]|uniref:6,7-dimethyl-8-ribityllumazine synthase n=1 Tax=Chelatococcus sambhunathii TaxID=363953 RepID=A0ABU1DAJ6_9HYPH|nr:6,7-dimethyl-8-ribityllumazine synthase [Chelatococcus sambhunathii]MDR4305144.1 6,7-dimethyl-8-ribityllumazine synthase [Chelatococcus sambhunathii]
MAEPQRRTGAVEPTRARVLVVEARFYDEIADALLDGAIAHLEAAGAEYDVVTVPGALELPTAIALLTDTAAERGAPYDAAVALGTVIRGETTHYEIVSNESARALLDLSVARKLPLGNGILTVENEAQAFARARRSEMDKGGGAAEAALTLVRLKRRTEG